MHKIFKLFFSLVMMIFFQHQSSSQSSDYLEFGFENFNGFILPGQSSICRWSYNDPDGIIDPFIIRVASTTNAPIGQICAIPPNGIYFPFLFLPDNPNSVIRAFEITCNIPAGKYFKVEGACCASVLAGAQSFCNGVVLQNDITYMELDPPCNDLRDIRFIICNPGVRHYNIKEDGQELFLSNIEFEDNPNDEKFKVAVDGTVSSKFVISDPSFKLQFEQNTSENEHGILEEGDSDGEYIYTHPTVITENNEELTLRLLDENDNLLKEIPVKLYQPPVLFVHGLWGNSEAFMSMQDYLISNYSYERFQLQIADYEATNDNSFETNAYVVPRELNSLFKSMHENDVACGKADIVAHSMGGLITRLYQQSGEYNDDINRIVTLNTPHAGSQLGNLLLDPNLADWRRDFFCDFLVPRVLTENTGSCTDGAVQDLAVNSQAIASLTNNANINPTPNHALSSTVEEQSFALRQVTGLSDEEFDIVFNNEDHDEIVAYSSQRGGLANGFNFLHPHVGIADVEAVQNYIGDLLEIDKTSGVFESGFNPPVLSYQSPFQNTQNSEVMDINVTNITDGQEVMYNSDLYVAAIADSPLDQLLVAYGSDAVFDANQNITGNQGNYTHAISPKSLGLMPVTVYGSNNTSGGYEQIFVDVTTNEIPTAIIPSNVRMRMEVGGSARVLFNGYFNGFNVNVAPSKDAHFNFSRGSIIDSIGNGFVKATRLGSDTLRLVYNGVESSPLVIEVYQDFPVTTDVDDYVNKPVNGILKVYPTPAFYQVVVELPDDMKYVDVLNVYDVTGKQIRSIPIGAIQNKQFELDLSAFTPGMYFIHCLSDGALYVGKFIKS